MKGQRVQSLSQGTQVFGRSALRGISYVVLTSYLALISAPAAAAVRQEVFGRPKPLTEHSIAESELAQMRETMRQFRLEQRLAARAPESVTDKLKTLFSDSPKVKAEKAVAETLLASCAQLQDEAKQQDQELAATRESLLKKHLPDVILARHDAAVQTIQQRRAELYGQLDRLQQAQAKDDDVARSQLLDAIDQKLEAWGGKQQAKTDYKHLPWGSPDSKVRAPHESKVAYSLHLEMFGIKPLQVAGPIPPGTVLPVLPQLPATPQPGDLGETEDIQLTPAIRAKAAELHNNPAEIYRWVHDTIEYIPTYGSIQGADYTLQTKRGNAFDTSSLLIGLLRAAGVPARYVYGTVEVPIEQAKNWVGGVTSPDAVLNLMGQGGIPNVGLTLGGKIVAVRMEHVWVEAFVDFVPSRGVKNKVPDTWVPMDASYKQYTYTAPMDLKSTVPFDAQALINDVKSSAVIDEQQGYIQGLDQNKISAALSSYQVQIQSYLREQSKLTLGEVFGAKNIVETNSLFLSQTLPLKLVTVAGDFIGLPDTLRHYFVFSFYEDEFSKSSDRAAFTKRLSLPYLSNKSLALSFRPSTSDDQQILDGYLPRSHADGSPIEFSELPSTLPGYLISVTPELTVDEEIIASGPGLLLGSDIFTRTEIYSPNSGFSGLVSENALIAGEYHAIAVDGQGVSPAKLLKLSRQLEEMNVELSSQGSGALSRHKTTGLILQLIAQSYFAVNGIQDQLSAKLAGVMVFRQPSYGTFSGSMQAKYSWGMPTAVGSSGMTMDMDHIASSVVGVDGQFDRAKQWRLIAGNRMSVNEALVPAKMISADPSSVIGVTAVKAIEAAIRGGQKVYLIDGTNANESLNRMTVDASVKEEILMAVGAGKQVYSSEGNINLGGWVGSGYVVLDPETGAGAYKISGGQNGARLIGLGIGLLQGIAVIALFGTPLAILVPIIGAIATIFSLFFNPWVTALAGADQFPPDVRLDFFGGRLIGMVAGIILSMLLFGFAPIFTPMFMFGMMMLMASCLATLIATLVAFNDMRNPIPWRQKSLGGSDENIEAYSYL